MKQTRRQQWEQVRSLMLTRPDYCAAILASLGHDENEPRHAASPTAKFCEALDLYGLDDESAAPADWRAAFARAGLNAQGGIPSALIPYEHLQQEANRHEVD
jgi:hypothetical protein